MDDHKPESRPESKTDARPEGRADQRPDLQRVQPSLKSAIRQVRIEEAERSAVTEQLRGAEIARLEMLAEALEPVFAQVPETIDIFDAGVMPSATPRLYIDMVGFVEMGPDKRIYRFIQTTRHGRIVLASSERLDAMVSAVNSYVARRIVEREQALAGDRTIEEAVRDYTAARERTAARAQTAMLPAKSEADERPRPGERVPVEKAPSEVDDRPPARRRFVGALVEGIVFLAELIGFIVLLVALFGALYFGWTLAEAWWVAYTSKAG